MSAPILAPSSFLQRASGVRPVARIRRGLLAAGLCGAALTLASTGLLAAPAAKAASPASPAAGATATPRFKVSTSLGAFVLQLDRAAAPKTVANFEQYVRDKHYDGTVFHRVISNFMIQGGGMDAKLKEKPTRAPIPLEARNGLSNRRGTVAMARTSDPNSATAQFFVNVRDNLRLDAAQSPDGNGYTVFGSVVEGMDVVDKIREVPTTSVGPYQDVPAQAVTIQSIVALP